MLPIGRSQNRNQNGSVDITRPKPSQTAAHTEGAAPRNGKPGKNTSAPSAQKIMSDFLPGANEVSLEDLIAALRQGTFKGVPRFVEFLEDKVLKCLTEFQVQGDIAALQKAGVRRAIIGMAVMAVDIAAASDKMSDSLGRKKARQRGEKALHRSIALLTKIGKLDEPAAISSAGASSGPLDLANRLENYAKGVKLRDALRELTGFDSALDIAKYAFVGSVKRITGTYHDREVSALIAATLQNSDYHMEAHRSWRKRLYERLDQKLSIVALVAQAANSILVEG